MGCSWAPDMASGVPRLIARARRAMFADSLSDSRDHAWIEGVDPSHTFVVIGESGNRNVRRECRQAARRRVRRAQSMVSVTATNVRPMERPNQRPRTPQPATKQRK